jgi:hypothetical protein
MWPCGDPDNGENIAHGKFRVEKVTCTKSPTLRLSYCNLNRIVQHQEYYYVVFRVPRTADGQFGGVTVCTQNSLLCQGSRFRERSQYTHLGRPLVYAGQPRRWKFVFEKGVEGCD